MQEKVIALAIITVLSMSVYGCSSKTMSNNDVPAVRVNITDVGQRELQQAISSSLHLPNVKASTLAFTKKHTLLVEKEILEGFDMDIPTVFRLFKNGTDCVLENKKTQKQIILESTNCVAL